MTEPVTLPVAVPVTVADHDERLRRWRLVLGGGEADGTETPVSGADAARDAALDQLYGEGAGGRGGLGSSAGRVARWLGDIRTYFPNTVVQVLQRDALDRLGLTQLLLEPELLEAVTPDVHLVGALLALRKAIPEHSRETARMVVRQVTDDLEARLAAPTRQAVTGALHRASRARRPAGPADIDWARTIAVNLRHYQPDLGTVIPERLIAYGRRAPRLGKEIHLCVDQSGSMAASVVYASVFGAVLSSVRSLRTRLVAFDTSVVDLTDELSDPVDVLFGLQLGGGTDIAAALAYCQSQITRPRDTVFVLLSDLLEGGTPDELLRLAGEMVAAGVTMVALLALSDEGAPHYDADVAAALAEIGVPAFACTPDRFPDVMAAAIDGRNLQAAAEL